MINRTWNNTAQEQVLQPKISVHVLQISPFPACPCANPLNATTVPAWISTFQAYTTLCKQPALHISFKLCPSQLKAMPSHHSHFLLGKKVVTVYPIHASHHSIYFYIQVTPLNPKLHWKQSKFVQLLLVAKEANLGSILVNLFCTLTKASISFL